MENLKILVIDDEFGIRESVKRALRKFSVSLPYIEEDYGFEIDSAETAEEGMEMMRENSYSILLLDNQLPGMNGTELLEKLHEAESEIITIMITAFASIETAITATKNGAYDFLTKPFKPEELKNAVHKAAKHYILNSITKKLTAEKNKIRFQFISNFKKCFLSDRDVGGFLRDDSFGCYFFSDFFYDVALVRWYWMIPKYRRIELHSKYNIDNRIKEEINKKNIWARDDSNLALEMNNCLIKEEDLLNNKYNKFGLLK